MDSIQIRLKVFLVVPTYNGQEDIPDFFSSLKESLENTPYDVHVVVVDNNSHDQTVSLVQQLFPQAQVLQNEENKGYAGISRGMQYALDCGADYIAALNQDLVFTKGWLEPLIAELQAHPNVGAAQSGILLDDEKQHINSYGNALHYLGFGYTLGHKQPFATYAPTRPVFYCCGACVMFRASVLSIVGLFDEIYFLYHEDTDLSWRIRLAGYDLAVVTDSVVYHKYVFGKSTLKFFYIERNRLLNLFKNYQIHTLILIAPMFAITEIAMIGSAVLGSLLRIPMLSFFSKIRTYGFFFKPSTWRYITKERAKIALYRRISDTQIVSHMVSDIAFQDLSSPMVRYVMNPLTRAYWAIIRPLI